MKQSWTIWKVSKADGKPELTPYKSGTQRRRYRWSCGRITTPSSWPANVLGDSLIGAQWLSLGSDLEPVRACFLPNRAGDVAFRMEHDAWEIRTLRDERDALEAEIARLMGFEPCGQRMYTNTMVERDCAVARFWHVAACEGHEFVGGAFDKTEGADG